MSTVILYLFIVKPTLISTALNDSKISGDYLEELPHYLCMCVGVCVCVSLEDINVPKTIYLDIQERWKTDIHAYDRSTRYAVKRKTLELGGGSLQDTYGH